MCSQNPVVTASLATATTTAVVLRGSDIQDIIQQIGHWGFIDYVTIMLFDLLIKSGYFEDEGYNQLTLENNEVDEVAEELVNASVNNTPETSPTSSQNEELSDTDAPIYDPSGREKLQDLLNKMNDEISGLIEKINYHELSTDFSNDALQLTPICHKRKNVEDEDTNPANLKASRIDDDPPPSVDDSSDEEEEEKNQSGGKRTRYRKRKHNKNKTKKIKHAKKHTKKHKKHMKKHTKKH
jgi:hypothetical protein